MTAVVHSALQPADTATRVGLPTDQAALTRLHRRLHAVAKAVVKRDDLADDAVQRVLIRLWDDGAGFDARKGSLETWLAFLTRRAAIDVLRVETRQRRNETFGHHIMATIESPEDALESAALRGMVHAVLAPLPDAQRIVVEATYLGERTNDEVARELGLPLGTVKSRIRRGMHKLIDLTTVADSGADVGLGTRRDA